MYADTSHPHTNRLTTHTQGLGEILAGCTWSIPVWQASAELIFDSKKLQTGVFRRTAETPGLTAMACLGHRKGRRIPSKGVAQLHTGSPGSPSV